MLCKDILLQNDFKIVQRGAHKKVLCMINKLQPVHFKHLEKVNKANVQNIEHVHIEYEMKIDRTNQVLMLHISHGRIIHLTIKRIISVHEGKRENLYYTFLSYYHLFGLMVIFVHKMNYLFDIPVKYFGNFVAKDKMCSTDGGTN